MMPMRDWPWLAWFGLIMFFVCMAMFLFGCAPQPNVEGYVTGTGDSFVHGTDDRLYSLSVGDTFPSNGIWFTVGADTFEECQLGDRYPECKG